MRTDALYNERSATAGYDGAEPVIALRDVRKVYGQGDGAEGLGRGQLLGRRPEGIRNVAKDGLVELIPLDGPVFHRGRHGCSRKG